MARCQGIKRDGGRCAVSVPVGVEWCFNHDPARAGERRRNASKAGKSVGGREIKDLKRRLSDVVDAVLEGSQDRGRAAVAIQGFNALKGVLELERRAKETEDLERRIEELERASEGSPKKGARTWQGA